LVFFISRRHNAIFKAVKLKNKSVFKTQLRLNFSNCYKYSLFLRQVGVFFRSHRERTGVINDIFTMKYNPSEIEAKWQKFWKENETFKTSNTSDKPKYYVLDMFPYPSGAGLHVGHPLGYIASDIFARYKRHKGFNVLHPQGYDSFGLPAEQYAIQTGQHPAITTEVNITRYREQLDQIGFSFDWSREIRTSNADYYKHTQWIFIQLFNAWYNKVSDKAEAISTLVALFEQEGNANLQAVCDESIAVFTAAQWNAFSVEEKERVLLQYRLTYPIALTFF